jgi:hypothetical protein
MKRLAVIAVCSLLGCRWAGAEDYPYPGVFSHFDRNTYDAFSPALKEVACYERFVVQDENGDFTTYVLDGVAWLREQRIAYLILSTGHCDSFPHARIEQCTGEDAADNSKSLAFMRIMGGDIFGTSERIYSSEEALLIDRGGDAVRIKCGAVEAIKPYLTTARLKKGSCHEAGYENDECYYEASATPAYNDLVGNELRKIREPIQSRAR